MIPNIQLRELSSQVTVFWECDTVTPGVTSFNLYWSKSKNTASTLNGLKRQFTYYTPITTGIANFPSYNQECTSYKFNRADIGLTDADTFYVIITENTDPLSPESLPGNPRIVYGLVEQPVDAGGMNSPLTKSENLSQVINMSSPTLITFTMDVRILEIKNFSTAGNLFVDVTGIPADPSTGMPVAPGQYYVIDRNISKDTGVSLIGDSDGLDIRIFAHY